MKMNSRSTSLFPMTLAALLTALICLMAFVPNLGYINLVVIKATTIHIPVVIGAIFLGPKYGAFLGFIFGVTSFINNTYNPSLLSFAFSPVVAYEADGAAGIVKSLFIAFVPRMLIGVVSFFVCAAICRRFRGKGGRAAGLAAAGVAGALTNTILVMGSIYLLYRDVFASAKGIASSAVLPAVLAIVGTNGVPEAIASGALVCIIGLALSRVPQLRLLDSSALGTGGRG